jgi:excisionase family DNA binding protein
MQTIMFTSRQVARWCGVDLKTIHNWVDKKQLKAGRTPGRHLRIAPEAVRDVLAKIGAPIPEEVTNALKAQEKPTEQSAENA